MIKIKTERCFSYYMFADLYGNSCSIQASSLATKHAIWLGIENAKPQVMATDAKELGIETEEETGWINYPVPEKVLMTTRMHLDREQAKELLKILKKFVDTGEI